jgi:hypothetical protein
MELDLFFGVLALSLGAALSAFSAPLTDALREGDDRWREERPWTQTFEPRAIRASDEARFLLIRAYLLGCSAGFIVVGVGLALRGTTG